jgi:phage-related holin
MNTNTGMFMSILMNGLKVWHLYTIEFYSANESIEILSSAGK